MEDRYYWFDGRIVQIVGYEDGGIVLVRDRYNTLRARQYELTTA